MTTRSSRHLPVPVGVQPVLYITQYPPQRSSDLDGRWEVTAMATVVYGFGGQAEETTHVVEVEEMVLC
jgi:hypothetical protein